MSPPPSSTFRTPRVRKPTIPPNPTTLPNLLLYLTCIVLCSCNFSHQEKSTPEFKMEMEELRIESVDPSSAITQNLILGLRTVKGKGQSFYKLQIIDEYPSQRTIYSQLFDQAFNIVELFTFDYISQGCITHDSLKLKMVPLQRHVLDGVVSVTSFNHGGKRSQIWLHGFQEFEDVIDVSLPLDLFKNSKRVFIVLQVSFPCAISPIYRAFWCHNGWRKSIYYDIDDIGGKEGDKLPVASPYLWYQNHLSLKEQKNLRNSFHRDGYNYFYISEDDLSMFPKCETLN